MKDLNKDEYAKIARARSTAATMKAELEAGTWVGDPDDVLAVAEAFLDLSIATGWFPGYPGSNGGF